MHTLMNTPERPDQCAPAAAKTADLLGALAEVEAIARQTAANVAAGLAPSGANGLQKIAHRAADARRWHLEQVTRRA